MTIAIIQARLGSARLPGKVLADLVGRPLLAHVIERAQAIRGVDEVVLSVPHEPDWIRRGVLWTEQAIGDVLTIVCASDPADVLRRFYGVVSMPGAMDDTIVRITGDCPLLAPDVAETALAAFHAQGVDYLGTTRPELAVPDGMDVEIFTRAALETAHQEATDPEDREHVTRFLWRQPERFKLGRMAAVCESRCWRGDCPYGPCWALGLKLSVDEMVDLERCRAVMARLVPWDFSMEATLKVAKEAGL